MTVSTSTSFVSHAGNGSLTIFAYTFKIFQDSDLLVTLVNDTTGVETTQTLTTDYTVSGAGSAGGGNVTFITAPASGTTVKIRRVLPVTQETDYVPNDPFPAEAHEDALDKLTMLVQQEAANSDLAISFPEGDVGSGINNILPSVTGRSDKLLKFGLDGGVEVIPASDITSAIIGANYAVDTFTGTGSTTVYTLSAAPGSKANTAIYIDGVYQAKANYSVSGSTLTFTTAPPLNAAIEIVIGDAIPAGAASTASAVSYTQGGTGAVTTNVQAKLRETVSVKDFGAVGDGVTDDTAAIQAAINYAANNQKLTVIFPAGTYNFTKLYLHYDAVNNPSFPSQDDYRGRIRLQGVGCGSKRNWQDNTPVGTVLRSTDAVGPAIYCNGDPLSEGQNRTDHLQIFDMAIWATNSTWVVKWERVTQRSGFERVFIGQDGTGGGIEWTELWLSFMRDVNIEGAGPATSSYGLYMTNLASGLAGGIYELTRVNINDFDVSWQLGHPTYGSGARMHSLVLNGCQAGDSNYGMKIGHGIDQVTMTGFHFEENDIGLSITRGASTTKVQGSSFINGRIFAQLGDNTADGDRYRAITLDSCLFISDSSTEKHIEIYSTGNTGDVLLQNNIHTGDAAATDTAIWLEDVLHHHVRLLNPEFNTGLTAEISSSGRIQEYHDEEKVIWRTVNTGGVLSEVPFQFKQDSTIGAQPVIDLYQQDNDEPFLKFSTDVTAGTGVQHINTTNSGSVTGPGDGAWTFSRMVKVQVEDSVGTADYWMPLFTKV